MNANCRVGTAHQNCRMGIAHQSRSPSRVMPVLRPLRVFCRPSGARLLDRSRSRGLRPWLPTLAPSEPESATPARYATPTQHATSAQHTTPQPGSPKGTTVGSQGRKPLDSDTLEQQSPGGAKEDHKRRIGTAHQSDRPGHLWWAIPTLLLTTLLTTAAVAQRGDDAPAAVRFEYIDVYVDSATRRWRRTSLNSRIPPRA